MKSFCFVELRAIRSVLTAVMEVYSVLGEQGIGDQGTGSWAGEKWFADKYMVFCEDLGRVGERERFWETKSRVSFRCAEMAS